MHMWLAFDLDSRANMNNYEISKKKKKKDSRKNEPIHCTYVIYIVLINHRLMMSVLKFKLTCPAGIILLKFIIKILEETSNYNE